MPSFVSLTPTLQNDDTLSLIPFKTSAGVIIGGFFMSVFGAFSAFRLFSLANNDDQLEISLRKFGSLVLSGLFLSLGSWSCQLINGRIALLPGTAAQATFIQFNPRFVCLSFLVPLLLICGSTVVLSTSRLVSCCRCIIYGLVIGFSVNFMHVSRPANSPG